MSAVDIRPPEEQARFVEHVRMASKPHQQTGIWRHLKKDGTKIEVEIAVSDISFGGRPARLVLSNDVTDRRRTEASLAESEARLRAYLESAPEGIVVASCNGRIEFVNAKIEEIFGYSRAELIGERIGKLLPETECVEGQASVQPPAEATGRRKDGSAVPVEISLSTVPLNGGTAQIAFLSDVSARKEAEAARRKVEERLRHMLDNTSDFVWEVDEHCVYTYVSSNVRTLFGYEPGELVGKTPFDIMTPEEAARSREFFKSIIQEARPFAGFENTVLDKSGRPVVVETNGVPFFDEAGVFRGYRGIDRDITARKRADSALRESEASLARAQQIAHLGNWERDLETGRLRWSDEVYRIFGLPPDEPLTRERFYECVHPDDRAAVRKAVETATSLGTPYTINHRIVLPDGSERHVHEHAEVVRDASGTVRLVGTVQDVTEYKRLEEQLRQAQRMEAVGRLAGGVAHDFNNLLTIIAGYSELLAAQLPAESAERKDLNEIMHAAERATALTRQLLAFSRRQILQMKVIGLNTVVADVDKMLRRLIGEDVELVTLFDPELGSAKADPTQIEQVIMNLAVNARDAMPGGGRLLIETANADLDEHYCRRHPEVKPGRYVMLAVTDNGAGMTPAVMRHIFEPFFTTKSRDKGTGLGLSTVYGIIKQSGGSIFCHSEVGRGTTFKIFLPRVDEHAAAPGAALLPLPTRGAETVLVVEDEPGVRALIRTVLESSGYKVLEAERGVRALELLRRCAGEPVALMITDVVMPEMSGRELAQKVREIQPDIQILFISGYTDEAVVQHGPLLTGSPFLQKPFTHDALVRKIREILDAGGVGASGA
jgi:PAS domain S-box-containing protein